jgi:hypothetical protein
LFGFLVGEGALRQRGGELRILRKRLQEIVEGRNGLVRLLGLHKAPAQFESRFCAQFRGQLGVAQIVIDGCGGGEVFAL